MSRFFSTKYQTLVPYSPGEQPKDGVSVKLNTNESPFPPSPLALEEAVKAASRLQLYPDPECIQLREALAARCGVDPEEVIVTNGSDEVLNFAFMAFCDKDRPAAFPNITYGFYPVFAALNGIPWTEIPLRSDFTVCIDDYKDLGKTIFIANPNAPTGIALTVGEIEEIVRSNPRTVVVVDEAYVDFGSESCIPLIHKYENLLVTQTFSKSRSMAGARLGFGIGCKALIRDLNTVRYSTNPYNVNAMTLAAGLGALKDEAYTRANCRTVMENRAFVTGELQSLGFALTDSSTNFVFVRHSKISGKALYRELKARGILVRHFDRPEITDYNRITVGTRAQMETLCGTIESILEEKA